MLSKTGGLLYDNKYCHCMKVKVCGLTDLNQFLGLEALGVSFAGFIFYPPSPRYALNRGLKGSDIKKSKGKNLQGRCVCGRYL